MNTIQVSANYTVSVPESANNVVNQGVILNCDSTSGAIAITVPAISTFGNSPKFSIVVNDAAGTSATNPITVTVDAGDKVNNATTTVLNQTGKALTMNIVGPNDWDSLIAGSGLTSVTAIATASGATTGTIANGNCIVAVTSADANNIIILPAPIPGTVVKLINGGTGYELRTNSPTTVAINGGTGAAAESAIAANINVVMECFSPTTWIGSTYTSAGVKGVVEVAAP